MARNEARDEGPKKIDLEKVAQLIDALERDLAKVQSGSRDVQLLRVSTSSLNSCTSRDPLLTFARSRSRASIS